VLAAARRRQNRRLGEDIGKGAQQSIEEGGSGHDRMHSSRGWRGHATPAYVTALLLERHGPGHEIPDDGPQRGHPLCPQDHVVSRERHYVKVDVELHAGDDDWSLAEDIGASHALAIGYCRREPWTRLDVQPRVADRMQGENRGLRTRIVGVSGLVANLKTTYVKDPPANAVVSSRILLVAVETQAEPAALLLLRARQAFHRLLAHWNRGWDRLFCWARWEGKVGRWGRQNALRWRLGGRRRVLFPEF
jgi:hypothetical protein